MAKVDWSKPRRVTSDPFALVPVWVYRLIRDTGPSRHRHLTVYVAMRVLSWDSHVERSIEEVMGETGLSRAAVYATVRLLIDAGAVIETSSQVGKGWRLPVDNPSALSTVVDGSTALSTVVDGAPSYSQESDLTITKTMAAAPPETVVDGDNLVEIEALCDHLAARIFQFRDGTLLPDVTPKWINDMRLLLERGPTDVKGVNPIACDVVRRAIDFVFDELAEPVGAHSFSWAKQVRSPGSLRRHWTQLVVAAREAKQHRVSRGTATIDRRQRRAQRDSGARPADGAPSLLAGTTLDPHRAIETQGVEA